MSVTVGDGGAGWESGDSLCRGLVEGGNMASLRDRKKATLAGVQQARASAT